MTRGNEKLLMRACVDGRFNGFLFLFFFFVLNASLDYNNIVTEYTRASIWYRGRSQGRIYNSVASTVWYEHFYSIVENINYKWYQWLYMHRRVQHLVARGRDKLLNRKTYFIFFSHEKVFIFYVKKPTGIFFNWDQKNTTTNVSEQ